MKKILFALAALAILALSSCSLTLTISPDAIVGDWNLYTYNGNSANNNTLNMSMSVSSDGTLNGIQYNTGTPTSYTGSWSKSGGTYSITTNILSDVGNFSGSINASGDTMTLYQSADTYILTKN